jgi:hypothetical protein
METYHWDTQTVTGYSHAWLNVPYSYIKLHNEELCIRNENVVFEAYCLRDYATLFREDMTGLQYHDIYIPWTTSSEIAQFLFENAPKPSLARESKRGRGRDSDADAGATPAKRARVQ